MRWELLRAKAMNKAYVPFTTDSVMLQVASYYEGGDPNDAMLAHYLLGCVYRDLGEAPRAIDSYQKAIGHADTTKKKCDYYTLASSYAQMGMLFHQQFLLSYEAEAHRQAVHFNLLAKDTLNALYQMKMIAGDYILQNKPDSAELVLLDVIANYERSGFHIQALQTLTMLMHIYKDLPNRLNDLRQVINKLHCINVICKKKNC